MNCHEVDSLIPALLAGDLSPEDHAILTTHLEVCPSCRDDVAALLEVNMGLDHLPTESPSPQLKEGFNRMLREAKADSRLRSNQAWALFGKVAAVFLLVGGGFLGGVFYHHTFTPEPSLADSNLALLSQGGEDMRLSGIMLASQAHPKDAATANALLNLLNHDPSEAVRLSAVDALYLFGRQPQVRASLIDALAHQHSTRVQLALVDLLASLREQRAAEALHQLLNDPRTNPAVARRVEVRLKEMSL